MVWLCKICTYENSDTEKICSVCSSAMGAAAQAWECKICTFINNLQDSHCLMCESPHVTTKEAQEIDDILELYTMKADSVKELDIEEPVIADADISVSEPNNTDKKKEDSEIFDGLFDDDECDEVKDAPWTPEIMESLSVNKKHIKVKVKELCEEVELVDISSSELITILKNKIPHITKADLALWANYSGGRLFSNTSTLVDRVQTIVTYCEEDSKASPLMKKKLRYVTKTLKEKTDIDPVGILILLAAHGQVCNVQKEVGVNMAYSVLMGTTKEDQAKLSLDAILHRILYTERELIVEELFFETGGYKNTHPLVKFRNAIHEDVGLDMIPDPNDSPGTRDVDQIEKFWIRYSPKRILSVFEKKMNGKDRKIPYDMAVNWFKENALTDDPYDFLGVVFDMDTGDLKTKWIAYLLQRWHILDGPPITISNKAIEADMDLAELILSDILPEKPILSRQVSADPKMPFMVRQKSVEAEHQEKEDREKMSELLLNSIKDAGKRMFKHDFADLIV